MPFENRGKTRMNDFIKLSVVRVMRFLGAVSRGRQLLFLMQKISHFHKWKCLIASRLKIFGCLIFASRAILPATAKKYTAAVYYGKKHVQAPPSPALFHRWLLTARCILMAGY